MLIPINNVTYFIIHIWKSVRKINMRLLLGLALDIQGRIYLKSHVLFFSLFIPFGSRLPK